MLNVVCVLRSGGDYDADYVYRLKASVESHLTTPHKFICLSDVDVPCKRLALNFDWPKWWAKIEMFRPDIKGDIFSIDLDTMIIDNIDELASVKKLTMLSDFYHPNKLASGLMYLPEEFRPIVWKTFIDNPEYWIKRSGNAGDQKFLSDVWNMSANRWQKLFPDKVISYKEHVIHHRFPTKAYIPKGVVPKGAAVICFHGFPRPHEINWSLK